MTCLGIHCTGGVSHADRAATCTNFGLLGLPVLKSAHRGDNPFFRRRALKVARSTCRVTPTCCHSQYGHPARYGRPAESQQSPPATSSNFSGFLWKQLLLAAGTVAMAVLLARPVVLRWQQTHQPLKDPVPAAIWLPKAADTLAISQPALQQQHVLQRAAFGAISGSLPASSGRFLRISDAILMQLTVTLQQVHMPSPSLQALEAPLHTCSWQYSWCWQLMLMMSFHVAFIPLAAHVLMFFAC